MAKDKTQTPEFINIFDDKYRVIHPNGFAGAKSAIGGDFEIQFFTIRHYIPERTPLIEIAEGAYKVDESKSEQIRNTFERRFEASVIINRKIAEGLKDALEEYLRKNESK